MNSDLQHCDACQEEYIAGVAACVECGGALTPGPLERGATRARPADGSAEAATGGAGRPDRLLAQMPGMEADHAVRALLLEEIRCRVECQGIDKVYTPGRPPDQPFAVTLPVTVYVDEAQHDAAQEILASLQEGDVIGEQWSDAPVDADHEVVDEEDQQVEVAAEDADQPADEPVDDAPAPQSTTLRTVVLLVIVGIVLLFVFGR